MVTIIGILGKTEVLTRIVGGPSRLEYRGYDSVSVAITYNANVTISKAVGKLENFRQ